MLGSELVTKGGIFKGKWSVPVLQMSITWEKNGHLSSDQVKVKWLVSTLPALYSRLPFVTLTAITIMCLCDHDIQNKRVISLCSSLSSSKVYTMQVIAHISIIQLHPLRRKIINNAIKPAIVVWTDGRPWGLIHY